MNESLTKNADLGLFVLAMHSLMERALKEKYHSDEDFAPLIKKYKWDYELTYGTPIYPGAAKYHFPTDKNIIYQNIRNLYQNHFLSNEVRHRFAEIFD